MNVDINEMKGIFSSLEQLVDKLNIPEGSSARGNLEILRANLSISEEFEPIRTGWKHLVDREKSIRACIRPIIEELKGEVEFEYGLQLIQSLRHVLDEQLQRSIFNIQWVFSKVERTTVSDCEDQLMSLLQQFMLRADFTFRQRLQIPNEKQWKEGKKHEWLDKFAEEEC